MALDAIAEFKLRTAEILSALFIHGQLGIKENREVYEKIVNLLEVRDNIKEEAKNA